MVNSFTFRPKLNARKAAICEKCRFSSSGYGRWRKSFPAAPPCRGGHRAIDAEGMAGHGSDSALPSTRNRTLLSADAPCVRCFHRFPVAQLEPPLCDWRNFRPPRPRFSTPHPSFRYTTVMRAAHRCILLPPQRSRPLSPPRSYPTGGNRQSYNRELGDSARLP